MGKGEIAQNEQFHLFPQCFQALCIIKSFNSHISSAASLNLGRTQNCVLGNGLYELSTFEIYLLSDDLTKHQPNVSISGVVSLA